MGSGVRYGYIHESIEIFLRMEIKLCHGHFFTDHNLISIGTATLALNSQLVTVELAPRLCCEIHQCKMIDFPGIWSTRERRN